MQPLIDVLILLIQSLSYASTYLVIHCLLDRLITRKEINRSILTRIIRRQRYRHRLPIDQVLYSFQVWELPSSYWNTGRGRATPSLAILIKCDLVSCYEKFASDITISYLMARAWPNLILSIFHDISLSLLFFELGINVFDVYF